MSLRPRLANTSRTRAVRVVVSSCGKTWSTRPAKLRPGYASTVTEAGSPAADLAEVGLEDLRVDPHHGEISEGVKPGFGLDVEVGERNSAFEHSGRRLESERCDESSGVRSDGIRRLLCVRSRFGSDTGPDPLFRLTLVRTVGPPQGPRRAGSCRITTLHTNGIPPSMAGVCRKLSLKRLTASRRFPAEYKLIVARYRRRRRTVSRLRRTGLGLRASSSPLRGNSRLFFRAKSQLIDSKAFPRLKPRGSTYS